MPVFLIEDFLVTDVAKKVVIDVLDIKLYTQATVRIHFVKYNGEYIKTEFLIISGDDYKNWDNDDSYLLNFVLNKYGIKKLNDNSSAENAVPYVVETITESDKEREEREEMEREMERQYRNNWNNEDNYLLNRIFSKYGIKKITEPGVTDAVVNDAVVTEPGLTDALVTDAVVTDALVTDSDVSDPVVTDSDVSEPVVTDSDVTDAVVTDAVLTDAVVTDAVLTDAVVTDAVVTDAVVTDAVVTDSVVTDSVITEFSDASGSFFVIDSGPRLTDDDFIV